MGCYPGVSVGTRGLCYPGRWVPRGIGYPEAQTGSQQSIILVYEYKALGPIGLRIKELLGFLVWVWTQGLVTF